MEQQRLSLSQLILDTSAKGEDRILIKKIGNFETLILLLKEDLETSSGVVRNCKITLLM
jgi:hypothetical protein